MWDSPWFVRTTLALLGVAFMALPAGSAPLDEAEEGAPALEPPPEITFSQEETAFLIEPPFDWDGEIEEQPAPPSVFWPTYEEHLSAILDGVAPAERDTAALAGEELEEPAVVGLGQFLPDLAEPNLQTIIALLALLAVFILLVYGLGRLIRRRKDFAEQEGASVIGRVRLTPRVSVHFIRIGDRVLVVGVGQNEPSVLTEFPAENFDGQQALAHGLSGAARQSRETAGQQRPSEEFWAELQAQTKELSGDEQTPPSEPTDVNSLRDDIQRLRQTLEDSSRDIDSR